MRALLVGINAKFIHSCLAVHSLSCYAKKRYHIQSEVAEFTINQQREEILGAIWRSSPELVGFSCYIWNIGMIRPLVRELRQVMPAVKILLGGPEVSFDPEEILTVTGADFVLTGEGEESFSQLMLALAQSRSLEEVPGLVWRLEGVYRRNPPPPPLDLKDLPFVYENFSDFSDRILYYEAQRGCPFHCQYCLSSVEKGVRFQPLDKVKRELKVFLDHRVRQVKFVDRTFNANPRFAMEIWRFLKESDNGVTNFHFELAADLLTEEMLNFLAGVRPGLFQFEIGVQSTHPPTLEAIERKGSFEEIAARVRSLQRGKNIHLHLDLIAGLPYEGYKRFGQSFDQVYGLGPDQFQLGFLKLLKGSGLRQNQLKFGITARKEAPYEVLFTRDLSYGEMLQLKDIEELVDSLYNSCRFKNTLRYLTGLWGSPFSFYENLAAHCREQGYFDRPASKLGPFEILYAYGKGVPGCDAERLAWYLKLDYCCREKPKKLPVWMPGEPVQRERIYRFFSQPDRWRRFLPEYPETDFKLVSRLAHLEIFPFDPFDKEDLETAVLFNYRRMDILGNASLVVLQGSDL